MSMKSIRKHCADTFPMSHRKRFYFRIRLKIISKWQRQMRQERKCVRRRKRRQFTNLSNPCQTDMIQKLSELGDSLSGGERQRIGIARAFLHDCPVIFLDEPTSNIDSLNESIILKSLYTEKQGKQILLVSHRKSTMAIADTVIEMN